VSSAPLFARLETSPWELAHRVTEGVLLQRGIAARRFATRHGSLRVFDVAGATDATASSRAEPPLVMLHGLGASALALLPLALSLDGSRRCLVVDLFDFAGDSQRTFSPFGVRPRRVAEHAQVVVDMLERAEIDTYDLYGVSLGAWTALHVAALAHAPRRVLAVVPLGTRNDIASLRELAQRADVEGIAAAAERFAGEHMPGGLGIARGVARLMLRAGAALGRTQAFARALDDADAVDDLLAGIRSAVRLIAPDHDRLASPGSAQAIFDGLPAGASSGVWAIGAAHDLPVSSPGLVTLALREFVGCTQAPERAPGLWARSRLHIGNQPALRPMVRT
jgi:pimeloyl-ACP methyl ester carboxylesterase